MSIGDKPKVVVREETILEKFDGEPDDGILVERVYIINGRVEKVETFKDGKLVGN